MGFIRLFCYPLALVSFASSLFMCSSTSLLAANDIPEIRVHGGEVSDSIAFFKERNFWGPEKHSEQLTVPRVILAVTSKRWHEEAKKIPVQTKKELFYRAVVPMVLLANELIGAERQELQAMNKTVRANASLAPEAQQRLQTLAETYGLTSTTDTKSLLEALLQRVDTIPPSLALGQAAYESGYGTSRFALEGNALFGQWTYDGKGMKPKEHRASKGNYGVAAYDWPFDSVKSYMKNLNSHRAYASLREKRALLRKEGKGVTGMRLAETLDKYSEKGMEYVKTLQGIIKVNGLDIADSASLRDEVTTLLVGVGHADKVGETEKKIEELRKSGELARIIQEMGLQSE